MQQPQPPSPARSPSDPNDGNQEVSKEDVERLNNRAQTIQNWQAKLNQIQIPKTLMNQIVLNFLIVEGYKEGAKKFVKEANIDLEDPMNRELKIDFNEELMDQRMQVRKFILSGKIKQAINLINEINPQVSHPPAFILWHSDL